MNREKVLSLRFKDPVSIIKVNGGSVISLSNGCQIFDHYKRAGGGEARWDIEVLQIFKGVNFQNLNMFIVPKVGIEVIASDRIGKVVISQVVNCYDDGEGEGNLELRASIMGMEIIQNIEKACRKIRG